MAASITVHAVVLAVAFALLGRTHPPLALARDFVPNGCIWGQPLPLPGIASTGAPHPAPASAAAPVRFSRPLRERHAALGTVMRAPARVPATTGSDTGAAAARAEETGAAVLIGESNGDWYLSGVQARIWAIWRDQLRTGFPAAVVLEFRIEADGTVAEVTPLESSGDTLVDVAAQRAIRLAAPFAPLPASYGRAYTVRAVFKPDA